MELTMLDQTATSLRAGYQCPCGCTPSVTFERGDRTVEEGCCCGNHLAVGSRAAAALVPTPGFRLEAQAFDAPWGERLEAAWLVGPSVHGPAAEHHHEAQGHTPAGDDHGHQARARTATIDPVCGMSVDGAAALAKGLHVSHNGMDHFFCGKGCKLEFADDPERYLDPAYVPSM